MPAFQLVGLDPAPFEALFDASEEELRARHAVRRVATGPGYPCRISLEDAAAGDELLLLPFEHQPAASPYRASGPIFVRRHARRAQLPPGLVPPYVTRRQISLRAYDEAHLIVAATVCDGPAVAAAIEAHFARPDVAYLHLHNAQRGCFSCRVDRV